MGRRRPGRRKAEHTQAMTTEECTMKTNERNRSPLMRIATALAGGTLALALATPAAARDDDWDDGYEHRDRVVHVHHHYYHDGPGRAEKRYRRHRSKHYRKHRKHRRDRSAMSRSRARFTICRCPMKRFVCSGPSSEDVKMSTHVDGRT